MSGNFAFDLFHKTRQCNRNGAARPDESGQVTQKVIIPAKVRKASIDTMTSKNSAAKGNLRASE
jgi:hypothetical protein